MHYIGQPLTETTALLLQMKAVCLLLILPEIVFTQQIKLLLQNLRNSDMISNQTDPFPLKPISVRKPVKHRLCVRCVCADFG